MALPLTSGIDTFLNTQRQAMLSSLDKVPGNLQLQGIFAFVMMLMAVVMVNEFRKGREERKNIWGPFSVMLFCFFVMFGFSVILMAWILMFVLITALVSKLKKGEWRGVIFMLVPIYFLAYLTSVNTPMLALLVGGTSIVGMLIKKANFNRTYGTSEAARMMNEQGYPVKKERKIIRRLNRIAGKGYSWSKDKVLRVQSKIRQRLASKELVTIEKQEHEAEIAAAGKKIADSINEFTKQEYDIEKRDMELVGQILAQCQQLKSLTSETEHKQKDQIIMVSRSILKLSNKLIRNKMDDEGLKEKANKILEQCVNVIDKSSYEIKQLKERKGEFEELRKAVVQDTTAIKKRLMENLKSIEHARRSADSEKLKILKEKRKALESVEEKVNEISGYISSIINKLERINVAEDQRAKSVETISAKAKNHEKKLLEYHHRFENVDKRLKEEHKRFSHLFEEENKELPDEELVNIAGSTVNMFKWLRNIAELSYEYNAKELKPLIADMAEVARNISYLSKESEYLNKMYYRLSKGMEALTDIASTVEVETKAKEKLAKIREAEEIEEKLERRAYRKGMMIISQVAHSYKALVEANNYLNNYIRIIYRYGATMDSMSKEVGSTFNNVFKSIELGQIKQAQQMKKAALRAEAQLRKGKKAERSAARAV